LGLTFFGLTYEIASQVRAAIFTQIHQIVFHGKGGYNWHTIYNMPIWLRKFTFKQIRDYYDEEKNSIENQNKSGGSRTVIGSDGKITSPEFLKNSS